MAAKDKSKILVAVNGDVYNYPMTESAPTSANSALPSSAKQRGYITDAGLQFDDNVTQTDITAWQDSTKVRTINSDESVEITLATLQFDDENLEWWVGSPKKADGSYEFNPSVTGGRQSYDFFIYDRVNMTFTRIYVPEAEITDRDALTFVSNDAATLGATITAYKSDIAGYTYKIWHGPISGS